MNLYLKHRIYLENDRVKVTSSTSKYNIQILLSNKSKCIPQDPHLFCLLNSQPLFERKYRNKNNQNSSKKFTKKIIRLDISNDNKLVSSQKGILPVEKFCSRLKKIEMLKIYSILKQPLLVQEALKIILLNSLIKYKLKWPFSNSLDYSKRNANLLLKGLSKQSILQNLELEMKIFYTKTQMKIAYIILQLKSLKSLSISMGNLITKEFISILAKTLVMSKTLSKLKLVVTNYASLDYIELINLFDAMSETNITNLDLNMSNMKLKLKVWKEVALGIEKCIQLEDLNILLGEIAEQGIQSENMNGDSISKCFSRSISRLKNLKYLVANWDLFTYFACSTEYFLPNLRKLVFRGFHLDLTNEVQNHRSISVMMPKLRELDLFIMNVTFGDDEKLYLANRIFNTLYRTNENENLPDVFLTIGPEADETFSVISRYTNILLKNKTISLFKSLDIPLLVADASQFMQFFTNFTNLEHLNLRLCHWAMNEFSISKFGNFALLKTLKSIELNFYGRYFIIKSDQIILHILLECTQLVSLKLNLSSFSWQLKDQVCYLFIDSLSKILTKNPIEELSLTFPRDIIWNSTIALSFIRVIKKAKSLKFLSLPDFSLSNSKDIVLKKFIAHKWDLLHNI